MTAHPWSAVYAELGLDWSAIPEIPNYTLSGYIRAHAQAFPEREAIVYLGLDVTPWLTFLGGCGQSDLSVGSEERDSDFEWLGAIQWRMLEYLALDPLFNDSACRVAIDAEFRGIGSQSEGMGGDLTWIELFGALTMSFTVNTERGELLDRISVFAGPAYSTITATRDNGLDADLNEDESLGFIAGLEAAPSENVTLRLEFQAFDASTFGGSCTQSREPPLGSASRVPSGKYF